MVIHEVGVELMDVLRIAGIIVFVGLIFYVASLRREIRLRVAAQQEVIDTRNAAIVALAALAETHDSDTGAHLQRTQEYVKALAVELRRRGKHKGVLTDEYIELLRTTAPLHDVGKVGIPDSILRKPGKLTKEEFEVMQTHTTLGHRALHRASKTAHGESAFLRLAAEIALTHHERWDGKGYPQRLEGENIPLCGRIMALADVYDALLSKRCYKAAIPHEEVIQIIAAERGRQFDPDIVDAFLAIEADIFHISQSFIDDPEMAAAAKAAATTATEPV
ncbi:hypothetical protein DB346_02015 [Verrucomicrobia bacterium LW23]|nr:hypothetical protein DB346_02015 [Verrucomicrobia bacterium LW23]